MWDADASDTPDARDVSEDLGVRSRSGPRSRSLSHSISRSVSRSVSLSGSRSAMDRLTDQGNQRPGTRLLGRSATQMTGHPVR